MRKTMPSGYGNRHFYGNINGNAMADEQESEDEEEEELIEEEEENLQDDEQDYEDNGNANEGLYEDDDGLDGYCALPQQYHQGTSQEHQKSPSTSEDERLFFRPVKRSYRQVNSNGEDDNAEDINAGEENEENDFLANGQVPMVFEQSIEGRNTFSHSSRERPPKKKSMASLKLLSSGEGSSKKPKRKSNNVWNSRSSRKNSKKSKASTNNAAEVEDSALITPIHRLPDKVDDTPEMKICLSKFYKAERIELSEERLTAGSTKGYRMVRATRGVVEGAWYFEIKVVSLGETGHTRLGWCTDKGDIQAPVGYDGNSYGYRDVDGSKVHKAVREPYGDSPYVEGDVIGFYISLPDGGKYAPKPPQYVYYRGQPYSVNSGTDEVAKVVPGSEIIFFRNGLCQGVAFQDIFAGRYYPAASMYTLPNQPNCTVRFNFGPTFECYPEDFGSRPQPKAMHEAPYCGIERKPQQQSDPIVENGHSPASKADNNDVNGQSSDSKAETKVANDQSSDSKAETKVANGESSVLVGEPDDTNGQSSEMQTENHAENGQLLGLEVEANYVNDQYCEVNSVD